ncbi:MAG: helix-turn-helix domain-containing protein [Defluviitaleaceae bacterium]|nr:helix-turn-helix domain-containing protein [Defluviitaleaceae bacterium]
MTKENENENETEVEILNKEYLINSFFYLGGNSNPERTAELQEKLEKYIKINGSDKQIEDILRLIEMYNLEAEFNDFEKSCEIVAPIIERANAQDEFDLFDIRIITVAVGHTKNYAQSWLIGEKLLRDLEKYKNHHRYSKIKMAIHSNVAYRPKRAKYYENVSDYEELKKQFSIHIEEAIRLCKKEDLQAALGTNFVRKGIFVGDLDIIEKGLSLIKENGTEKSYEMALNDINEHKSFIKFPVTTLQLKSIIGKNIKIHRKVNRIRCEELADMLGISGSNLRHIERGYKAPSLSILFKLSGFLKVSIDTLFHDTSKETPLRDKNALELNEISTIASKLTDKELKSAVIMLRQILHLREDNQI